MFEKEKETQSEVMEGLMNPSLCSSMNAEFDIVCNYYKINLSVKAKLINAPKLQLILEQSNFELK